jgi:hypothetical protein
VESVRRVGYVADLRFRFGRVVTGRGAVMADRIMSAAAIAAWMRVLDQVQESIARAVRDVGDHERALDAADPVAAGDAEAERRCLDQFDERLRHLQTHLDAADDAAAQVEDLLTEDERETRAWLAAAAAASRTLAGAGAVGLS